MRPWGLIRLSRNTNKMQLCNRIYYSKVYSRLNMFREPHRSFIVIITKLHLVGISTESSTMHGSMSIKYTEVGTLSNKVKMSLCTLWRRMGERSYSSTHSYPRQLMQLYLCPGKCAQGNFPLAWWSPKSMWTLQKRQKPLRPTQNGITLTDDRFNNC